MKWLGLVQRLDRSDQPSKMRFLNRKQRIPAELDRFSYRDMMDALTLPTLAEDATEFALPMLENREVLLEKSMLCVSA